MLVSEIMTPRAECIGPDATLQEAANRMKELECGSLPVCDNDRLAGMLTDRDITIRSTSAGRDPTTGRVREAMTPGVIYCSEDEEVEEAARLMKQNQVRRLPVLNREKRLVGIVSLGDLAVETQDDQLAGSTLEAVSEPNRADVL